MTWRPVEATLFLEKAAAPTVNDDQNEGYLVGDIWLDETNDAAYLNLDVTVGAAVWKHTSLEEAVIDHGSILGLGDDDHPHYHNNARGDARYYTETELDAGQLDNRYFRENEFLNASAGAGDADKPVILDAAGHVDATMINDADIDHGTIGGLVGDDHLQYHTDARGDARYYTETELDAGQLDDRYFTEAEHINSSAGAGDSGKPVKLDAAGHIDATMINDGDVDHTAIANIGTNTHAQVDTHIADGTKHFLEGAIDHGSISGLADIADHPYAVLITGARSLTGDWNIGNHKLGINTVPSYPLHIVNAPGDETLFASYIDLNPTGTLTDDREYIGSYVDIDSSTDRDGHALELKGFRSLVTNRGDATIAYGFQSAVTHDSVDTATQIASIWGNTRVLQGAVSAAYGSRNRVRVQDTGAVTLAYAMYGQIQMLATAKTLGTAYGSKQSIEQTAGTITTGYLFHGAYTGTIGTKWGIYLTGETQSYLSGNLGLGVAPGAKLDINSDIIRLRTAKTPASAGAAGNAGDICWDATYIYICVATNTWERVEHVTWA